MIHIYVKNNCYGCFTLKNILNLDKHQIIRVDDNIGNFTAQKEKRYIDFTTKNEVCKIEYQTPKEFVEKLIIAYIKNGFSNYKVDYKYQLIQESLAKFDIYVLYFESKK